MTRSANTRALRLSSLTVASAAVLAISACGTHESDSAITAAERGNLGVTSLATANAPGTSTNTTPTGGTPLATTAPDTTSSSGPTTGTSTTNSGTTGSVPQSSGVVGGSTGTKAPVGATAPTAAATGTKSGGTATKGATSTKTGATATTAATNGAATCTSAGTPIVIGQTGGFSGLVGAASGGHRTGLAIWAKAINSAGGIQCHPVQLYSEDDGSNPGKASSNSQDLIENKHAIALVDIDEPITIAAVRSVVDKDKIPVVGGDLVELDWNQDQYLFPQGTSPFPGYAGGMAAAAKAASGKNIGYLYCVEAAVCGQLNTALPALAKSVGLNDVFSQSISLTQSDYTSECQNAKAKGVNVLLLFMDGAAMQRVARSCQSIGYKVPFATASIAVGASQAQDSLLQTYGVYEGAPNIPFTATSDTPGGQLFAAAVKRYAAGQALDQNVMTGWASGQLFAAALNADGTALRGRAVTTQDVLDGLYKLKGETLGGLAPPLTYVQGQPAPQIGCFWDIAITSGGFSAPAGSARQGTC